MAVTFDAGKSEAFAGDPTSHSFAFTVATNSNRLIYAATSLDTGTDENAAITYNSVSMNLIATRGGVETFQLIAPTEGSNILAASWDNGRDGVLGVASFSGVNQSTPVGTNDDQTNTGTSSSGSVTDSASGDMVVNLVHVNNLTSAISSGTGSTENWESTGASGDSSATGERKDGASGTVTLTTSWTGSLLWIQHTINLNAVAAAGDLRRHIIPAYMRAA